MKSLHAKAALAAFTVFYAWPTAVLAAPVKGPGESTPVNLGAAPQQHAAHTGGGGSIIRTLFGLLVVVGVIYGVYWLLKQVKKSKEERASGSGLSTLATLPLGPGRSLHMVRAGGEVVILGVGEQGVTPIRTYTEEEAYAAGLLSEEDDDPQPIAQLPAGDLVASSNGSTGRNGNGSTPTGITLKQAFGKTLEDLRARTVRK
jgi:flagellar protein FliO/FliZ